MGFSLDSYCLIWIIMFLSLLSCNKEVDVFDQVEDNKQDIPGDAGMSDLIGDENDFVFPELNSPHLTESLSNIEIYDNLNDTVWKYNMILPPSYSEDHERYYPVLYLLHGLGSDSDNMARALSIGRLLDYFYENELIPEIIAILPSCGTTYWVDDYVDGIKYETFFFEKFLPEIESVYRIEQKLKRNIFGTSMGGYGAAHYAFTYPELFGYCYSASGTLTGKGTDSTPSLFDTVKNLTQKDLPYLTIDIGDADSFVEVNKLTHQELDFLGITHEFILREGKHDWDFWRGSVTACLYRLGRMYSLYYNKYE